MIAIIIILLGSCGSRGSLARRSCQGILVPKHHHTDSLSFGICHVLEPAPPAVCAGAGLSEVLAVTGLELHVRPERDVWLPFWGLGRRWEALYAALQTFWNVRGSLLGVGGRHGRSAGGDSIPLDPLQAGGRVEDGLEDGMVG